MEHAQLWLHRASKCPTYGVTGITKVQPYVLNLMYQSCNYVRNISSQYNAITKV